MICGMRVGCHHACSYRNIYLLFRSISTSIYSSMCLYVLVRSKNTVCYWYKSSGIFWIVSSVEPDKARALDGIPTTINIRMRLVLNGRKVGKQQKQHAHKISSLYQYQQLEQRLAQLVLSSRESSNIVIQYYEYILTNIRVYTISNQYNDSNIIDSVVVEQCCSNKYIECRPFKQGSSYRFHSTTTLFHSTISILVQLLYLLSNNNNFYSSQGQKEQ